MIVYTDKHRIPFQIDADDYETVGRYFWHFDGRYVATAIGVQHSRHEARKMRRLHEFLLGKAPDGMVWGVGSRKSRSAGQSTREPTRCNSDRKRAESGHAKP